MGVPEEHRRRAPAGLAFAILTVSDTRTPEDDASAARIGELAAAAGHRLAGSWIVPDEIPRIQGELGALLAREGVDVVVVAGGTGLSPRDRTVEAVLPLLDRCLEGFGELFRMLSYREVGAAAMLSRATAGVVGGRAVFVLPGSPGAVELAMRELILPEVGHLLAQVRRA